MYYYYCYCSHDVQSIKHLLILKINLPIHSQLHLTLEALIVQIKQIKTKQRNHLHSHYLMFLRIQDRLMLRLMITFRFSAIRIRKELIHLRSTVNLTLWEDVEQLMPMSVKSFSLQKKGEALV